MHRLSPLHRLRRLSEVPPLSLRANCNTASSDGDSVSRTRCCRPDSTDGNPAVRPRVTASMRPSSSRTLSDRRSSAKISAKSPPLPAPPPERGPPALVSYAKSTVSSCPLRDCYPRRLWPRSGTQQLQARSPEMPTWSRHRNTVPPAAFLPHHEVIVGRGAGSANREDDRKILSSFFMPRPPALRLVPSVAHASSYRRDQTDTAVFLAGGQNGQSIGRGFPREEHHASFARRQPPTG